MLSFINTFFLGHHIIIKLDQQKKKKTHAPS